MKPLGIKIIGLDWRDQPDDAKRWIGQFGDPYDAILATATVAPGIDFGVYMAPESFLVDAQRHHSLQAHRHVHTRVGRERVEATTCRARRRTEEESMTRFVISFAIALSMWFVAQARSPSIRCRSRIAQKKCASRISRANCAACVCQNQNLADSEAELAGELRRQVFDMMQSGKSDAEIKQYLVARYNDFVLYDPPVKPGTWLLWFAPGVLVLIGAIVIVNILRKRTRQPMAVASSEEDW